VNLERSVDSFIFNLKEKLVTKAMGCKRNSQGKNMQFGIYHEEETFKLLDTSAFANLIFTAKRPN